jgi:sugar O-acyltransferase (sialic acid O-acetyltransferase NeuD family)
MKRILVFGAGGHSKVVIDVALVAGFSVIGILDEKFPVGTTYCGIPILGRSGDLAQVVKETSVRQGVVAIGDNWIRARVVTRTLEAVPDFQFPVLIHPSAVVASGVQVGAGSVVMAGSVVNPSSSIGIHCILNTRASLDHDGSLGDYASIAPGCTVGGCVKVGSFSAIGLGANLIHQIQIGEHTVIGAGALVLGSIPDRVVAFGSPAKVIRTRTPGEAYL